MTLGKDVSALFPDVLKNIATSDLDQKKLVYLYLMWVLCITIGRDWHQKEGSFMLGTTQSHIQIYAFLPLTLSSKTQRTQILLSEH